MKVGIDARLYNQTGVGVYIRNLLFYFRKFLPKSWQLFVYVIEPFDFSVPKNWKVKKVEARWHSFSEQTIFLKKILKDNLDLMHFTYFSFPILYNRPFVITIHDLTPLKFKTGRASTKSKIIYEIKHFFYKIVLKTAITKAKGIIVPSKVVKKQLLEFGAKKEKIKVIYEGVDEEFKKVEGSPVSVKQPYFLYVGNFYPHKNVEFTLEGFWKFVRKKRQKIYFYLVGPNDFFAKRLKEKYKSIIGKKIAFFHKVSRSQLKFLYKNARALVHPSLSEGFGLTLLEAFYCNTPVLASDLEVFREIYGDLPLYFNPRSEKDFLEKLSFVLSKMGKRNFKNLIGKYSFLQAAKDTLSFYKNREVSNSNLAGSK